MLEFLWLRVAGIRGGTVGLWKYFEESEIEFSKDWILKCGIKREIIDFLAHASDQDIISTMNGLQCPFIKEGTVVDDNVRSAMTRIISSRAQS